MAYPHYVLEPFAWVAGVVVYSGVGTSFHRQGQGARPAVVDQWLKAIQWLRLYSQLRFQLLEVLSNEDLKFKLPGSNQRLGALCRQMGEVQHSYLLSFQNFEQDFNYRHADAAVESDLDRLKTWWTELDQVMFNQLEAIPEEVILNQRIQREPEFQVDLITQLQIYREALVIFYGKVSLYLKAMEIELPPRWAHWID